MEKYKKLYNNSLIFIIGNFGSKVISLLMVPLYTRFLTVDDYGLVDLVNTTISLVLPVLTLEIGQGVMRFTIEDRSEENYKIVYNTSLVAILGMIIFLCISLPILIFTKPFGDNTLFFCLLLMLNVINNIISQYARGINKIKEFAWNGVILTIFTVISNILFLVYLGMGAKGYLISLIISVIVSNTYLMYVIRANKMFDLKLFDKKLLLDVLKYSIPLIPNSVIWWIINGSTRYFILFYIGTFGNGIFAVANKIPSIISLFTTIFNQAWQISSFEEYDKTDMSDFYSKVFKLYYVFLFFVAICLNSVLKIIFDFAIDSTYFEGWIAVPFLFLAVIYQSLSSFYGTIYTAAKETKGIFNTSVYGGIFSIISSVILIPKLGVLGAGLGMCLSFFLMWLYRVRDTRKYVRVDIDVNKLIITNIIFGCSTASLYVFDNIGILIIHVVIVLVFILLNRELIIFVFEKFKK